MTKYDDASWHYEGDYPEDLSHEHAATHMGMFITWIIENDLVSDEAQENFMEEIQAVKDQLMTGTQFILECSDEKLTDDLLNEEGNAFALAYYETNKFLEDYEATLGKDAETLYQIEDSWDNYAKLAEVISKQFEEWKEAKNS